jgi:hypothetical protein
MMRQILLLNCLVTSCFAQENIKQLIIWESVVQPHIVEIVYDTNTTHLIEGVRGLIKKHALSHEKPKPELVEFNDYVSDFSIHKSIRYWCYVGAPLDSAEIFKCTKYLINGLYEEIDSIGPVQVKGLTTVSHKYWVEQRKRTSLADGQWFDFVFYYYGGKLCLFQNLSIVNGQLNGLLKTFQDNGDEVYMSRSDKYKNGILVDTLKWFTDKGRMYFCEIRNSEGRILFESFYYYPNSGKIESYYNYTINYVFNFYESGRLRSYARHHEGWEIGEEVIFDEYGIVIERIQH